MSPAEDGPRNDSSDDAPAERVATPPAQAAQEDLTGARIAGRYLLDQLVAGGPIGLVYRARRIEDDRVVAVKVLHARHRPDPNVVRRFAREAQAASQLDHPHIARTIEHGVDDAGRPFVCREWVDGLPITQAVAAGALTLRRILEPVCQALSALSEAHRHGVLHCGLRPSNLLVSESPEHGFKVKVCDFGMGRLLKAVPGTLTTKYGWPCGVAEYAAPEQAAPGDIDGRADVYAMGVVLYELLTGQVPFRGGGDAAVLARHRSEPVVPPCKLRVDRTIPREVEAICLKALNKLPAERYRSPRELRSALHDTLELLGARAELRIEEPPRPSAELAQPSRLTMPGEQLRSRQKIGLGVGLLLLVCGVVWLSAPKEAREGTSDGAEHADLSSRPLPRPTAAQLELARREQGETPELTRELGLALLREGERERGVALLRRYLELAPQASDRASIEALLTERAPTSP
jgi:serine/threonine-protein kinase